MDAAGRGGLRRPCWEGGGRGGWLREGVGDDAVWQVENSAADSADLIVVVRDPDLDEKQSSCIRWQRRGHERWGDAVCRRKQVERGLDRDTGVCDWQLAGVFVQKELTYMQHRRTGGFAEWLHGHEWLHALRPRCDPLRWVLASTGRGGSDSRKRVNRCRDQACMPWQALKVT